jgi:hypothetical protein
MAEETQYTANTGFVTITTANTNLDGSGTLGTVLTAGSNGTLIKTITVTSNESCSMGMIRLFIYDGSNNRLFKEIEVIATDASNINPRFEVHIPMDFTLKAGYVLKASTEIGESFNVIAEGLDWEYYTTSVRTDTTEYTANTGMGTLTTQGTGVAILTAGAKGCSVESVTIKAIESPNDGLVAIYLSDGVSSYALYADIKVEAVKRSAIASSYEYTYVFENDFELKAGYILAMITRSNQLFKVTAEGLNWDYPA